MRIAALGVLASLALSGSALAGPNTAPVGNTAVQVMKFPVSLEDRVKLLEQKVHKLAAENAKLRDELNVVKHQLSLKKDGNFAGQLSHGH